MDVSSRLWSHWNTELSPHLRLFATNSTLTEKLARNKAGTEGGDGVAGDGGSAIDSRPECRVTPKALDAT
eukprot:5877751-Prymnesium_polylepis.1